MTCKDSTQYYDDLWERYRGMLPGALDEVLHLVFSEIVRDFFQESTVWRQYVDARMVGDRTRYDLNQYVKDARVQWVLNEVTVDGTQIYPRPVNYTTSNPGSVSYYHLDGTSAVVLSPTPSYPKDTKHVLRALAVLVPPPGTIQRSTCGAIPGELMMTWYDAFLWGVVGRMMLDVAKPYSNIQQGVFFTKQYKHKRTEARDVAMRRNMNTTAPWVFPQFA